jgi:ATP-dependent Clp protease ATP-binding subunit ClpB
VAILRGLKERYEAHHKVAIADSALVAAATLSHRYIPGRQLPDKAIDLVDEASSRLRMEIDSSPVEIDELRRAVDRLTMEEFHLAEETDPGSVERLAALRAELADKQEELRGLEARWETEKQGLNRVGEIKERIDELRVSADRAPARQRLRHRQQAAVRRHPHARARAGGGAGASEASAADPMVREEVGPDEIAEVVAAWTGIPTGRLLEGETGKLLRMEEELGRRLIGQQPAVQAVSDAVRVPGPASPTPTGPPGRSCSSVPPASARPSWPSRWPTSCSTTSGRWSAST